MLSNVLFWYIIGCLISLGLTFFIDSYELADNPISFKGYIFLILSSWITVFIFILGVISGILTLLRKM